ncbi:MAG: hypothetical protein WAV08_04970, partial [Desulfobacterales bacterium]
EPENHRGSSLTHGELVRDASTAFETAQKSLTQFLTHQKKRLQHGRCNPFILLVGRVGIEPTTY